jgi:hypothetical protein
VNTAIYLISTGPEIILEKIISVMSFPMQPPYNSVLSIIVVDTIILAEML